MPMLNSILPPDLNPFIRNFVNFLAIVHLLAFLLFCFLLVRSMLKGPEEQFREEMSEMQTEAQRKKK
jgi:hypothetical protein